MRTHRHTHTHITIATPTHTFHMPRIPSFQGTVALQLHSDRCCGPCPALFFGWLRCQMLSADPFGLTLGLLTPDLWVWVMGFLGPLPLGFFLPLGHGCWVFCPFSNPWVFCEPLGHGSWVIHRFSKKKSCHHPCVVTSLLASFQCSAISVALRAYLVCTIPRD